MDIMKNILIIRHAESMANAGERTHAHDKITLSEKGKTQAEQLAKELSIVPDLIVISPFTRTQETALPFISKHPHVPVETWNVQEFTYLNTENYNGTTREERMGAIKKYWDLLDIHHADGGNAETFNLFINRIKDFVNELKKREEKNIVIFSHGAFILNLKTYLEKINGVENLTEEDIKEIMKIHKSISDSSQRFPIENVSVHKINI